MPKQVDSVNDCAAGEQVLDLIHGLMHQYRALQYQVLRDKPEAVTHMESKVLGFFARHPAATPTELARHSGRDKAQLARLIKSLRERGLLDGVADEQDKRSVRLVLTSAGQQVLKTLSREADKLNARAVAGLSADEHARLLALLGQVQRNLSA